MCFTIDQCSCIFAGLSCVIGIASIIITKQESYKNQKEKILGVIIKADNIINNFLQPSEKKGCEFISQLGDVLAELAVAIKMLHNSKIKKYEKYFSNLHVNVKNTYFKQVSNLNRRDIRDLLESSGKDFDLDNDLSKNLESLKNLLEN